MTGYNLVLNGVAGAKVLGADGNDWTSGGDDVVWAEIAAGSIYEGQTALGTPIFRISLNSGTGVVTFTQYEQLDHDPAGQDPAYTNTYEVLGASQISVTQSIEVTDFDGSTDTATSVGFDLGGDFRIGDDGPEADITVS